MYSPPEYPDCNNYLDNLTDMISNLEISHNYEHVDEIIYSKLCHIMWKNPELYKCIVMLMCGFHQLCLKLRLIYKRFNCIGIKEWFQLQKKWKSIITTDACAYTKNIWMH